MGTKEEILEQAMHRQKDGYTSAKLKVSNLNFDEAAEVIDQLKDQFRLRIDVNRAWTKAGSLHFFSQFALDAFDYVEEPFKNPKELREFTHPLAIDESFPADLSLHEMEELPTLKALIYKPTIQGGRSMCSFLSKWAAERKIDLVLSSSFETDLGLAHIAAMAHRFSLSAPVGIGTYHYLNELVCEPPLRFSGPIVSIPTQLEPSLFRESHRSTASK
ncbi:MAG: enolase C-terminal domain-like protein [Chlamydiia bacterium]